MKFNRLTNPLSIIGIIMIIISILIIFVHSLDNLALQVTYAFLMGSSEGKAIIFFFLMGSLLILSQFIKDSKRLENSKYTSKPGNYYLKLIIILVFCTFILGQIFEIWIRVKLGVPIFTTFVSTSPSLSTSSIIHSHVFKSMLGLLISDSGLHIPSNIHTGLSIAQYIPKYAMIIFAVLPTVYILGLLSLGKRSDLQKIILIFGICTAMIGMVDGGLFSTPALLGFAILIGSYSIKKPFSIKNLIKPSTVIIIILVIRVLIGLAGSNPEYYEVTVLGGHGEIPLQGFNVTNEQIVGNATIITVSSKLDEMTFFNQVFKEYNGKYPAFFVSWNIYSYL
ncbi:MAG: hypothetical protein WCF28_02005 [Methanobacterium sp.]|uniref:hypothetical protein n=1 Tax=Methanobacterium sp. TaxID=2164 RepID=UPI003C74F25F